MISARWNAGDISCGRTVMPLPMITTPTGVHLRAQEYSIKFIVAAFLFWSANRLIQISQPPKSSIPVKLWLTGEDCLHWSCFIFVSDKYSKARVWSCRAPGFLLHRPGYSMQDRILKHSWWRSESRDRNFFQEQIMLDVIPMSMSFRSFWSIADPRAFRQRYPWCFWPDNIGRPAASYADYRRWSRMLLCWLGPFFPVTGMLPGCRDFSIRADSF